MKLALATAFGIVLVVGSPFVGRIRAASAAAFPASFDAILAGAIAVAIATAICAAVTRIREQRRLRYFALVSALVVGATFSRALRTGSTSVDVVETAHFLEYGMLTLLFYLAWHHTGDGSVLVLPVLAGLLFGIFDEWFQWFIPSRVGELRDLLIDAGAVGCGLLFSIGFKPLPSGALAFRPGSPIRMGVMSALVIGAFALFFQSAYLGYQVADPKIGAFRSRFTAAQLESTARERAERWAAEPPISAGLVSQEDQYITEAIWHVRRRNMASADGDVSTAWRENRILEVFFAPVLDTPSYEGSRFRWPAEQRANVAREVDGDVRHYVSTAEPYAIYTWPKATFWALSAIAIVAVIAASHVADGRVRQLESRPDRSAASP